MNFISHIYPKELKTGSQRVICTPMFIAALFTIANRWKLPRFPLMDKWINKIWYIRTVEYHSASKSKENPMAHTIVLVL